MTTTKRVYKKRATKPPKFVECRDRTYLSRRNPKSSHLHLNFFRLHSSSLWNSVRACFRCIKIRRFASEEYYPRIVVGNRNVAIIFRRRFRTAFGNPIGHKPRCDAPGKNRPETIRRSYSSNFPTVSETADGFPLRVSTSSSPLAEFTAPLAKTC